MQAWLKDAAPSGELRQWFGHDPKKWKEFRLRYFRELAANPAAFEPIVDAAKQGRVTLLFSTHDVEHNNAVALRDFIEARLTRKRTSRNQAA
jgi:uncharacterized protein YeaO (DUF488 family)